MSFLGLLVLYGAFFKFLPGVNSKITAGVYFLILYLFLGGIEGFAASSKNPQNSLFAFWVAYIIILLIHLPLLFKLIHRDGHKHHIKHAREIFGKDLEHLTDEKLHKHLGH